MPTLDDNDRKPTPWTVEQSVHVLRDKWISVRADSCRTQDGILISPFYVLEYPDWVQVVAVDQSDQVVLVEQYRHGIGAVCLELPGGGMDPGDVDPISAGRRELVEETGFEASAWEHIATLTASPVNQNNRCHVILARHARPTGRAHDDPAERLRVVRRPVDEVARLARQGAITHAMQVAALALAFTHMGRW